MENLRKNLKEMLLSNGVTGTLYPAGIVLILIYPALFLLQCIVYNNIIGQVTPIFYVLYLMGIMFCLSDNKDWAVGTAFAIKAAGYLICVCKNFTFNTFLNLFIYGGIAGFIIYHYVLRQQKTDYHTNVIQPQTVTGLSHCTVCGKPVDESGRFCPFCGNAYNYKPDNILEPIAPVYPNDQSRSRRSETVYNEPSGSVALFCGSAMVLVLSVLLSANILLNIIANHSFITVISQIPLIIICIGCWILYVSSLNGNLTTTGFTMINGSLLALCIISFVPCIVGFISGLLMLIKGGSDFVGFGFGVMLGCVILFGFFWLYWSGLRKPVTSARLILTGEKTQWESSLFCIVMICISIGFEVISTLVTIGANSLNNYYLNAILSQITNEMGGGYTSNILSNYFGSLFGGTSKGLVIFNSLISIALHICAVTILVQIRKKKEIR